MKAAAFTPPNMDEIRAVLEELGRESNSQSSDESVQLDDWARQELNEVFDARAGL